MLGFAVLACNSVLAIHKSCGDAGSVAFLLAADAALVLLFLCLREVDCGRGGGKTIQAAVWLLTTVLTAMFAATVAALMPPAVAAPTSWGDSGSVAFVLAVAANAALALLFHCLSELERAPGTRPEGTKEHKCQGRTWGP
nr:unnamed protein product [Digitaria exilis]